MSASSLNKRKINPLLLQVLVISIIVHVAFLLGFGGYTVYKHVQRSDTTFEEAPQQQAEVAPPPQRDLEVMIQRQPQQVAQPAMRELRVQQVGNIAVAAVAGSVPNMQESFSVSGGANLAGSMDGMNRMSVGDTAGGIGLGMSELSVFGIQDKGERILFMVDASRSMLTDDKGGMNSYNAIKNELIRLIGNLAPGTLYNVMLYQPSSGDSGARIQAFQQSLVSATPANLARLKNWFDPINRDANRLGVPMRNILIRKGGESDIGKIIRGQTYVARSVYNYQYVVSQAILEQNVDLVYIITSEWPGFRQLARPDNEREAADWARRSSAPAYRRQLEQHQNEMNAMAQRVNELERVENEKRRRNGQPPIVFRSGSVSEKMAHFGLSVETRHPGSQPQQYIDARAVQRHFEGILKEEYRDKNLPVPRFNFIMFMAENGSLSDNQRTTLRDFTRFFGGGRFQELRGLPAIQQHVTGAAAN